MHRLPPIGVGIGCLLHFVAWLFVFHFFLCRHACHIKRRIKNAIISCPHVIGWEVFKYDIEIEFRQKNVQQDVIVLYCIACVRCVGGQGEIAKVMHKV